MALADFTDDHAVEVVHSEIESARFGYGFGRCTVPLGSTVSPSDIARMINGDDTDITALRYPADRVTWFDRLARQLDDHVLIYADTLAYWELSVGSGNAPETIEGVNIAYASDAATIGQLTTHVFAGYPNHYSANPLLSTEAVAAGYRDWAMRTSLQDALILFNQGSSAGMATVASTPEHIEILLAGITPEERGRGLYRHLLGAVEQRADEDSLKRVVISTQSHNAVVQRAWARYGFLPLASFTTLHVVKSDIWDLAQT